MEKWQPILLLAMSLVLAVVIFVLDESVYSLAFLIQPKEVFNLLVLTGLISVFPLILNFLFYKRFRNNSLYLALLGFLPAGFLISKILGL